MTLGKVSRVERPTKKSEWTILFASAGAQRGWSDLCATQRNATVDAWDALTRNPQAHSPKIHPLRGGLAVVTHRGANHEQWQLELHNGARIWYYVDAQSVYLVRVHTAHPNATK